MLGLWKSKKRKAEDAEVTEKNALAAIVTEDLLGGSEWKESKVGYLTGLSSVGRIASAFVTSFGQSFGRTSLVLKLLTKQDSLPSLPEVDKQDYDGQKRFKDAMRLHGVKDKDMARALSNTWRSFYFYGCLALAAVGYLIINWTLKGGMSITTLALHISPIPILMAYMLRAAVTNWSFRTRNLETIDAYFRSGSWLPKK